MTVVTIIILTFENLLTSGTLNEIEAVPFSAANGEHRAQRQTDRTIRKVD